MNKNLILADWVRSEGAHAPSSWGTARSWREGPEPRQTECAPDLRALFYHANRDFLLFFLGQLHHATGADQPCGPAPTITTSNSIDSRSTAVSSVSSRLHGSIFMCALSPGKAWISASKKGRKYIILMDKRPSQGLSNAPEYPRTVSFGTCSCREWLLTRRYNDGQHSCAELARTGGCIESLRHRKPTPTEKLMEIP